MLTVHVIRKIIKKLINREGKVIHNCKMKPVFTGYLHIDRVINSLFGNIRLTNKVRLHFLVQFQMVVQGHKEDEASILVLILSPTAAPASEDRVLLAHCRVVFLCGRFIWAWFPAFKFLPSPTVRELGRGKEERRCSIWEKTPASGNMYVCDIS